MTAAIARETTASSAFSYDAVPYTSYAFPQSDPRRLFCIATLFGIEAHRPPTARILEIGCASGGNIIPLAARLPDAQFVGLDYSARQIEQAQARASAIGLPNLTLHCQNVCDFVHDGAPFDYILCHGVYSWVQPNIQAAILRVCRAHLAPGGVAFVSYNTYPGWKTREILRDAMIFHTRAITEPREQLAHGRGMIDFMRGVSGESSAFSHVLRHEAQLVNGSPDDYILHEHLERDNHPCYFNQFVDRASQCGLAYLADATLPSMFAENLGPDLQRRLLAASGGDQIAIEQYLDFASNRTFRQSLLVRDIDSASICRRIDHRRLRLFAYRGVLQREEPCGAALEVTYRTATGATIRSGDPVEAAVLDRLAEADGGAVGWSDLLMHVGASRPSDRASIDDGVAAFLSRLLVAGLIEMFSEPVDATSSIDGHPVLDGIVRQITRGGSPIVANAFHEPCVLSATQQILLPPWTA